MEDLDVLETQIAITLCKFEMVFPPAFFDIMVHLPIHLAREAKLGGPVQYRWMYPIERYLRTLKTYVRNKARPEGSIAEGYLADECLTFCSRYLKNIPTKFNRPPRNDDRHVEHDKMSIFDLSGQARGRYESICLSDMEFNQACMYVLQNCEDIWPFIEKYKMEIETQGPVDEEFLGWFRAQVLELSAQGDASDKLISLGIGPLKMVHRYSTFMVNGFRFHTRDRASSRRTQNSGVLVRGDDSDETKEYYGVLEDIYELSYVGNKKVYLFKCHWWDVGHLGKRYKVDKYGIVSINTRYSLNSNEPFVLASQAEQVFYVEDICDPNWLVVVKTNPRDLFNIPEVIDNGTSEDNEELLGDEAYQQFEVDIDVTTNDDVGIDLVVCLYRDDVQPETINHSCERAWPSGSNTIDVEADFIDDDDDDDEDVSTNEEDREDILDDADTDDTDDTDNNID